MSAPESAATALTASAADVVAWMRYTFAGNAKFMENMDAYEQAFIENDIDGVTMSGLGADALVGVGIGNAVHRSQIITKWNTAFRGGGTGADERAGRGSAGLRFVTLCRFQCSWRIYRCC